MLLKRKRSDSEMSFSSNTTAFSSPPRPNGNAYNFSAMAMMDIDSPVSPRSSLSLSLSSRPCTPSHLPSRTRKRFRDSRPSDEEVHQHTLKILYEAQHQHNQQSPQGFPQQLSAHQHQQQQQPLPTVYSPPVAAPTPSQRSLHSFWNLPASVPSSASTTPAPYMALTPAIGNPQSTQCEDCGVGLGGEDVMMENEYGLVGASSLCGACGKAVCFSCSVSNLGEQRRCLMCAGRKKWVGGIGWAVTGTAIC